MHSIDRAILMSSREQDKPGYEPGLYACIACCLLTIVIVILITLRSWSLNKRADRGELELEYNDVCLLNLLLMWQDINVRTGWRPEGLQVYLLELHQPDHQSIDGSVRIRDATPDGRVLHTDSSPALESIPMLMNSCPIVDCLG